MSDEGNGFRTRLTLKASMAHITNWSKRKFCDRISGQSSKFPRSVLLFPKIIFGTRNPGVIQVATASTTTTVNIGPTDFVFITEFFDIEVVEKFKTRVMLENA